MITFFTTPKPICGHIGVIQRNPIESWKLIHHSVEVIPFGDEEGASGPLSATWPFTGGLFRVLGDCGCSGAIDYHATERAMADVV